MPRKAALRHRIGLFVAATEVAPPKSGLRSPLGVIGSEARRALNASDSEVPAHLISPPDRPVPPRRVLSRRKRRVSRCSSSARDKEDEACEPG